MQATHAINNIYKLISFLKLISFKRRITHAAFSEIQHLKHSAIAKGVLKSWVNKHRFQKHFHDWLQNI